MSFTLEQLMSQINVLMLPFIRLSAFFMAVPFFGAATIPVRIRIMLGVAATFVLSPTLSVSGAIDAFSLPGMMAVLQQALVGIALGSIFHFVMSAVVMAGHNVATTMGLSFASMADPQNGAETTVVGQIYTVIATLYLLGVDAHLLLLQIIAGSFDTLPLQDFTLSGVFFQSIVLFSSQIFVLATLLVLPVVVGVLLVNLGFAVMTRAAPQLNVFTLGMPLTILAGFLLMMLSLPIFAPLLDDAVMATTTFMSELVLGGGA
jgi:flagellar biosynthetic protein FliR